jgi:hypothetical protein
VTTPSLDDEDASEELPVAPGRSRWLRVLWGALAAAVLGVAVFRAVTADRPPAPRPPARQAAQVTPLDRVAALAAADTLTDFTRETSPAGACRTVPVGHDVVAVVMAVVRPLLAGARLVDAARTLDQFTGLCALEVRASGVGGTVITVSVSAPGAQPAPRLDRVTTGTRTRGAVTTRYALRNAADGWIVLVGAVGDARLEPSVTALARAARSGTLRW